MNRLLLVIAILFAFASLSGPTMAHAIASGYFWSAGGDKQCLEPTAAYDKAPAFKPCGKKINGQAVSCQPLPAVLPLSVDCLGEFGRGQFMVSQEDTPKLLVFQGWFRPPRA